MYSAHCDPCYPGLYTWLPLTSVTQVEMAVEVEAVVEAREAAASCTSWEAPSITSSWGSGLVCS